MRTRLPIMVLSAGFLVAAALLVFVGEPQAGGPGRFTRVSKSTTHCGFWGHMSAGLSCR
jgi:hypothetical protein